MTPRVLLTAFAPYAQWSENASWLALVELTKNLPQEPHVTTRLYPVDWSIARERLARDLADGYDFAIHTGQAPGSAAVRLEAVGLNLSASSEGADDAAPLVEDGPMAYRATLPLAGWARELRDAGFPACVSYHAGTFICNATLYFSRYLVERNRWNTQSAFVHLPLDLSQAAEAGDQNVAGLPAAQRRRVTADP